MASDFRVASEYEGFVSSAETLLSQFKQAAALDVMIYKIHPDTEWTVAEAIKNKRTILEVLEPLLSNYIWHKDKFVPKVILPTNGDSIFLGGTLDFGESIEDEWFVVFLMYEITTRFSTLNVSVCDADGEFLLIEAAAHLPDWLGPDNSNNRVWIRKGRLHIIRTDDAPSTRSGGVSLRNALDVLRANKDTLASPDIQKTIRKRLQQFPAKTAAHRHTAVCAIPKKVAEVLAGNPQLISAAVQGLGGEKDRAYTRYMSSMSYFGVTDTVLVPVTFTRALYAQLTFQQRFHPPPRFHAAQRKLQQEGWDRATAKAFDIGCRVACGLEIAYQKSRAGEGREMTSSGVDNRLIDVKRELVNRRATFPSDADMSDFVVLSGGSFVSCVRGEEGGLLVDACRRTDAVHDVIHHALSIPLSDTQTDLNVVNRQVTCLGLSESDDWLHFTPDEFERNIEERMHRLGGEDLLAEHVPPRDDSDSPIVIGTGTAHSSLPLKGIVGMDVDMDRGADTNTDIDTDTKTNTDMKTGTDMDTNSDMESRMLSELVSGMSRFMESESALGGVGDGDSDKDVVDESSDDDVDSDCEGGCESDQAGGEGSVGDTDEGAVLSTITLQEVSCESVAGGSTVADENMLSTCMNDLTITGNSGCHSAPMSELYTGTDTDTEITTGKVIATGVATEALSMDASKVAAFMQFYMASPSPSAATGGIITEEVVLHDVSDTCDDVCTQSSPVKDMTVTMCPPSECDMAESSGDSACIPQHGAGDDIVSNVIPPSDIVTEDLRPDSVIPISHVADTQSPVSLTLSEGTPSTKTSLTGTSPGTIGEAQLVADSVVASGTRLSPPQQPKSSGHYSPFADDSALHGREGVEACEESRMTGGGGDDNDESTGADTMQNKGLIFDGMDKTFRVSNRENDGCRGTDEAEDDLFTELVRLHLLEAAPDEECDAIRGGDWCAQACQKIEVHRECVCVLMYVMC